MTDPTIWRTPTAGCPACRAWRQHTDEERTLHHPLSRHGFDRAEWSHPALKTEAEAKKAGNKT